MRRELERALKKAGTTRELARRMGVSERTIRRWRQKGVPKARSKARAGLDAFWRQHKAEQELQRAERKQFTALFQRAKEMGRFDTVQSTRTRTRSYEGEKTEGVEHVKRVERPLTEGTLSRMLRWARSITPARGKAIWTAQFVFTQYAFLAGTASPSVARGFKEFAGYETTGAIAQMHMRGDANFGVGLVAGSHRLSSKGEAVRWLQERLITMLSDVGWITYIHSARIWNYRARGEMERRAWSTMERRKRKAKYERKKKSTKRKRRSKR